MRRGNPWVVNGAGAIYKRLDHTWLQLPSAATDIGVSGCYVWVTGATADSGGDYGIYAWDGQSWNQVGVLPCKYR